MKTTSLNSPSRRSVVQGSAWGIPALATALAAPARASNSCTPDQGSTGVSALSTSGGTTTATLSNQPTNNCAGTVYIYTDGGITYSELPVAEGAGTGVGSFTPAGGCYTTEPYGNSNYQYFSYDAGLSSTEFTPESSCPTCVGLNNVSVTSLDYFYLRNLLALTVNDVACGAPLSIDARDGQGTLGQGQAGNGDTFRVPATMAPQNDVCYIVSSPDMLIAPAQFTYSTQLGNFILGCAVSGVSDTLSDPRYRGTLSFQGNLPALIDATLTTDQSSDPGSQICDVNGNNCGTSITLTPDANGEIVYTIRTVTAVGTPTAVMTVASPGGNITINTNLASYNG